MLSAKKSFAAALRQMLARLRGRVDSDDATGPQAAREWLTALGQAEQAVRDAEQRRFEALQRDAMARLARSPAP